MAIPDNYIDKITKGNDSRMISPAADMVRVNNDNFNGADLDEVLDDVAQAISEAGEVKSVTINGTNHTPDSSGVVDLGTVITAHQDISGKQDKINDLSTIRSGAAKGASSVQTISVNGGTAQQPTNGVINLTVATGGDNDLVDLSDGTENDGAVVFTKRNGDTITLNLNHVHPQYQPLLTAGANITIAENAQTGEIVISSSGGGSAALIGVSFNGAPATVVNGVATITATIPANVSELNNDSGYAKYVLLADEAAYNALATKDSTTLYLIPEA